MVISGASVSPSPHAPPTHISCPALPRRSKVVGVIAPLSKPTSQTSTAQTVDVCYVRYWWGRTLPQILWAVVHGRALSRTPPLFGLQMAATDRPRDKTPTLSDFSEGGCEEARVGWATGICNNQDRGCKLGHEGSEGRIHGVHAHCNLACCCLVPFFTGRWLVVLIWKENREQTVIILLFWYYVTHAFAADANSILFENVSDLNNPARKELIRS